MAENVSLYALTERHPGEPLLKDKTSFRVDFSKQMAFPALRVEWILVFLRKYWNQVGWYHG